MGAANPSVGGRKHRAKPVWPGKAKKQPPGKFRSFCVGSWSVEGPPPWSYRMALSRSSITDFPSSHPTPPRHRRRDRRSGGP